MNIAEQFEAMKGTFTVDLGVKHFFGGGTYARQMTVPAGICVGKHVHDYDHLSILASGEVCVETGETREYYTAPACITIKAGICHNITAIKDAVWYCIHATDSNESADKLKRL